MSVYGHNGARKNQGPAGKTEALLRGTFEAAAELGEVPVAVCADANMEPGESEAVQAALATGEWFDAAAIVAEARGNVPGLTCHAKNGDSRVDWILVNRPALAALRDFEQEDSRCPTHEKLSAQFNLAQFRMMQDEVQRPRAFPVDKWGKDADTGWTEERKEAAARAARRRVEQRWSEARGKADVDGLCTLFAEMAEEYLVERSGPALEGPRAQYHGRGTERAPKRVAAAARQRPEQLGAHAIAQRRLLTLQRRLEELERQCRRQQGAGGPWVPAQELVELWRRTARQGAGLLPGIQLEGGARLAPERRGQRRECRRETAGKGEAGACWAEGDFPTAERREGLRAAVRAEVTRLVAAARSARIARWRERIQLSWVKARGRVFQWCKGGNAPPATVLRAKDGRLLARPED
eukprot:gene13371-11269_t